MNDSEKQEYKGCKPSKDVKSQDGDCKWQKMGVKLMGFTIVV